VCKYYSHYDLWIKGKFLSTLPNCCVYSLHRELRTLYNYYCVRGKLLPRNWFVILLWRSEVKASPLTLSWLYRHNTTRSITPMFTLFTTLNIGEVCRFLTHNGVVGVGLGSRFTTSCLLRGLELKDYYAPFACFPLSHHLMRLAHTFWSKISLLMNFKTPFYTYQGRECGLTILLFFTRCLSYYSFKASNFPAFVCFYL
jgi:hypothetical protein